MAELWQLDAHDLAAAIRNRSVSAREAVEAHLTRIDALNPRLNALTAVLAEQALAAAAAADGTVARGRPAGPLLGVPVTIKENIDLAGTPTTWGAPALATAVAPVDAPHVAHLRAAGAIAIGRTNLPDFALRWHTDSALRGATVNPWDASRTPGGSSGGDAVALATGMTALGVGNDFGGSLRWPAQCCGITAIRPTLGRVPDAAALPPVNWPIGAQLMNVQGPMARRVRDLRLALEVMSRPSPRDPWYVPAPLIGPQPEAPVRVALVRDPGGLGVDPAVAAGVARAAQALSSAGYAVEELSPPSVEHAAELWIRMAAVDIQAVRSTIEPIMSETARASLALEIAAAPRVDFSEYRQAFMGRQGLLRAWSEFLTDCPLVLAIAAVLLGDFFEYLQAFMGRQGLLRAWSEFFTDCPLVFATVDTIPP